MIAQHEEVSLGLEQPQGERPYGRFTPRRIRPLGKIPRGYPVEVDGDGFDPRAFLPEALRQIEWRERGHGEFRIPHRLNEFANRVTTTRNELLVLHCLLRFSLGFHRTWCEAGYSFICSWTGIGDPTNVKKSLKSLIAQGIVRKAKEHHCASNSGTIYELPVVAAYLEYLAAEQGAPLVDAPNGQIDLRLESLEPSRQIAPTPEVETPTKKEKVKEIKKTLSDLPSELSSYLESIKATGKRRSEEAALSELLETHSPNDVIGALNWIKTHGTLREGSECHSPMKYLSKAIGDVLARCRLSQIAIHMPKEEIRSTNHLAEFESKATEEERNRFILLAKEKNSFKHFAPSQAVLKILAATLWAEYRR